MLLSKGRPDIVVERAKAEEGKDAGAAGFVAKAPALKLEAKGASKAEAVDALEKAIMAKLSAPVVEEAPAPAPSVKAEKKKASEG